MIILLNLIAEYYYLSDALC